MAKRVKKQKKTGSVIQTVKVVVGDISKKPKRKYQRRPKKMSGMPEVQGGMQNTVYGDRIPPPPRIIEVPVPFRLAEGSVPATGFPMGERPPAITERPAPPVVTTGPMMPPVGITSGERPKNMITFPNPRAPIDAIDEGDLSMIRTALRKRNEQGFYRLENRLSQPMMSEAKTTRGRSPLISEIDDIEVEVKEPSKSKAMIEELPDTSPSLLGKVARGAASLLSGVADIAVGAPIGSTKAVATGISGLLSSDEEKKPIVEYATEAEDMPVKTAAAKKVTKKAKWNITDQLIGAYMIDGESTYGEAQKALAQLQRKRPNASRKDVLNALLEGDKSLNSLA